MDLPQKHLSHATCSRQGPINLAGRYKIWEAPRSPIILQFLAGIEPTSLRYKNSERKAFALFIFLDIVILVFTTIFIA